MRFNVMFAPDEAGGGTPPAPDSDAGFNSPSDLVAFADREYNKRVESDSKPPEEPAAEEPEAEKPADEDREFELQDGSKVTAKQIAEWRHASEAQKSQLEADQAAVDSKLKIQMEMLQRIMRDPAEYEKMRASLGLATAKPASDVIDPIQTPQDWRQGRTNQYRQQFLNRGEKPDEDAIAQAVERDLMQAQLRRQGEQLNELKMQMETTAREQNEIRQTREIESRLEGLYKKYPGADGKTGRRMVENELLRLEHEGKALHQINFEQVVKEAHEFTARAVKVWADRKDKLAAGTRGISRGGSGTKDPVRAAIDKLPDDTSAFSAIAEMRASGKLHR